jgi:hypothetical protein
MRKTLLINNPHEGPEEHEFKYEWVKFSDGLVRAIYSSKTAPSDYWPREVYISDLISGVYQHVGSYSRNVNGGYDFICNVNE